MVRVWPRPGGEAHEVGREGLLAAIPEGIHEDLVVLDGDRENRRADVKRAALRAGATEECSGRCIGIPHCSCLYLGGLAVLQSSVLRPLCPRRQQP